MATKTWNGSDGSFALGSNWSSQAVPVSGDMAIISAGTVTATGTLPSSIVLALAASNAASPKLILSDATLVSSSHLNMTAGGTNATLQVRGAVNNQGTITATGTAPGVAFFEIDDAAAGGATKLLNTGSILVSGTALQVVSSGANMDNQLENDGLISVLSPDRTPRLAYVAANITGTGTVLLGAGVTFEAVRGVSAGQTFVFDPGAGGATALLVDAGRLFNATIAGFAASDRIQLISSQWDTAAYVSTGANSGLLTLSLAGVASKTIAFQGSYALGSFNLHESAPAGSSQASTTITMAVTEPPPPPPPPPPIPLPLPPSVVNFLLTDTTTGVSSTAAGDAYSGPVVGLQNQYITVTTDNLNVTAATPNSFIHTGSGNDAIDVSRAGGDNVLDGSAGSNFLVGGTGHDTFFVDDRSATTDIWSTVVNFHTGDAVTIFGVTPSGFTLDYENGQGAVGSAGLTLHAMAPGKPIASMTLAGYTKADLSNGRLGVSFGTEPNGDNYMFIHGS